MPASPSLTAVRSEPEPTGDQQTNEKVFLMEVAELNAHVGRSLRQVPVSLSVQRAATSKPRHAVSELICKLFQNCLLLQTFSPCLLSPSPLHSPMGCICLDRGFASVLDRLLVSPY